MDFAQMVEEASQKGRFALFILLVRELIDLPVSLYRAYRKERLGLRITQADSLRQVFRIALGFGVVYGLSNIASNFWFFIKPQWVDLLPHPRFLGWDGTYKGAQVIWQLFSSLVIGPAISAIFFINVFSELRPVRKYLPYTLLVFFIPAIFSSWAIYKIGTFGPFRLNLLESVALLVTSGIMPAALATMFVRNFKRIPWLLLVGFVLHHGIALGLAFLRGANPVPFGPSIHIAIVFLALQQMLISSIEGLVLGFVATWTKTVMRLTS